MTKNVRKIITVSFDGCLHDGNADRIGDPIPAVIAAMKDEWERNRSVFVVETPQRETRPQDLRMLQSWGIEFAFYNQSEQLIAQAFGSNVTAVFERWDTVDDVYLTSERAVIKRVVHERDCPGLVAADLYSELRALEREICDVPPTHDGELSPSVAKAVASLEFALESFKEAYAIADSVKEIRHEVVESCKQILIAKKQAEET